MAYWLIKTDPDTWSWADQVKSGKPEAWTGVRNFQARANLMKMAKGDRALFYHSQEDKAVVGLVDIVREHYPDPTAKTGENWVVVDVKAAAPFPQPVTLSEIKADKRLADMVLVKNSRLSVQPVTATEWKIVCKMGGVKE
jgi:predicted RNA-binding protein with PUA-like domain